MPFSGAVKTEWIAGDGRSMRILEAITYTDKQGTKWIAPKNAVIDGASIPKFFWRFIGSPFVGLYRRPSVFHDVACDNQDQPYLEVHKMFHNAMLEEGVKPIKALAMYKAVSWFGPRW